MKSPANDSHPVTSGTSADSLSPATVITVLALFGASWILSGGCGLLGRPLASGLTWCCLAVIGAAAHPKKKDGFRDWCFFGVGLAVALVATASSGDVVRLGGIAVLAVILSGLSRQSLEQRILRVAALAVGALVLYRFGLTSIPLVWHLSDAAGTSLGSLATVFWGQPLSVGATFAGLDHLVIMAVLIAGWAFELERPRLRAVLLAVSAVVIGQTLYLFCLSQAQDLASALPTALPTPPPDPYVPPAWHWGDAARTLFPWNLPVVAAIWQLGVAAFMLRLGRYRSEKPVLQANHPGNVPAWQPWIPVALAALLPLACMLSLGKSDLHGKTVLVFNQGYLDWDVPVHGRYGADSSGRFGMLPAFVESLGGRFQRSSGLTQEELWQADLLILIHPNQPWPDDLRARVLDYVRQGGSLLVAAGPHLQNANSASSYNELLNPLGMPVRYDTAVSQNESWRHGMLQAAHPAVLGLGDDRDRVGMAVAASIQLPWRASPLLVGKWGWSDPGSDFFLTERARWDPNERLGDLVLASERRLGSGRVVVLGDNACLTNQGNVRAYRFTGRLLSYLARHSGSPQAWWRQLIALALAGGLLVLLARSPRTDVLAASVLALMVVLSFATWVSCRSWEVLPDGSGATPNNLAYLDASHLEAYAETQWSPDGIDGFALTLMRNGFLVLAADNLSAERLRRASLLVSIAPARRFSMGEKKRIKSFVENGGTLIAMAGAANARKANQVLRQFGLHVQPHYHRPGSNDPDAVPLGWMHRPYPHGEGRARVFFHAAWPVQATRERVCVVSTQGGASKTAEPIVAYTGAGRGIAMVIGDTCFAMNKALEDQNGNSLGGDRGNAHFWRWLIGQLPGHDPWEPPAFNWDALESQSTGAPPASEEEQP